jgi:penicillin amidase
MNNRARAGRIVGGALAGMAGLGALAGLGTLAALRHSLPRTSGTLRLPGLHAPVEVRRDRWGIPHIYAANNDDLFLALGYVHAQDRLWQMELNRRTAHGQLAELFGPIALSSDRFVRVLGFSRITQREVECLDAPTCQVLTAYVQGINAFLTAPDSRLPLEFRLVRHTPRPWEIADILVWGKVLALTLSGNWTSELLNARIVATVGAERAAELLPRYPDDHPITVPAGISFSEHIGEEALRAAAAAAPFLHNPGLAQGSNAWAVGGSRTTTGQPLLASDPHLSLTLPSLWYEAHLEGGDYAVAGVTFPGVPGVLIGHNAAIAWGITNSMLDVQDLYIERFHPDDPLRYAWQDDWEQADLVREEILVKGQPQPVVEEVRITRHGPVISSIAAPDSPLHPTEDLALRWTALEPSHILQAILQINQAQNWEAFRAALALWDAPPQNFVYADIHGHYGYALGGNVPLRAQGDGRLPVPGWDGAYEWTGYIPATELPAAYDPPEGFVLNANNRIAGDSYPYQAALQGEWLNGYRAVRIRELLAATPYHDPQSFARIQQDQFSLPGRELARLVADLPLDDRLERQAQALLHAWDGELTPTSVGAAIYATLRYHLERHAYADVRELFSASTGLGLFSTLPGTTYLARTLPDILARISTAEGAERHDAWLGAGRTWNGVLRECMSITVRELRRSMGKTPRTWQYGRQHRLLLRHALGNIPALAPLFNRGPWPTGGDLDTISMGFVPRDTPAVPAYTAPSYRQICDLSNWDRSLGVLSSGQSGHPGSRHYSDMSQSWRTGGYHPLLWSRTQVEQHTTRILTLEPSQEQPCVTTTDAGGVLP